MNCWNCGFLFEIVGKLSFRATCDRCGAALHCCQNCKYYRPGLPNDCFIPDTERIADRSASNFCEDFNALNAALGDKKPPTKERFDNLFKSE